MRQIYYGGKCMKKFKINKTIQIMISMVLGVIFGFIIGRDFPVVDLLGKIFLNLIQMSIILLVTGQIIEAIGGVRPAEFGKIGAKTVAIFLVSTFLAAIFGIFICTVFQPGANINVSAINQSAEVSQAASGNIYDTILGFFPSNIVQSMAGGVIVQVIVFSIIFGIALSYLNLDGNNKVYLIIKEFNLIILKVITMVMNLAPIGVFCLVATSIGKYGVSVVIPLAKYLGTYGLGTLLFLIIWVVFTSLYTKIKLPELIKGMSRMSLVALATTSSAVTLPIEIEDAEKKLGVNKGISQIVLPLGVSLNSNGAAMHMAVTILTIAQLYGVHYSFQNLIYIVVLTSFASLANAVVPGAGLVSLSIVVPQMGLPVESIALFAGVEWFVGMLRTILNVDADTFTALLVAKSENKIDYKTHESKELS